MSKPYFSFMAFRYSGDGPVTPVSMRNGSPGAMCINMKLTTIIAKIMGIVIRRRLRTYFCHDNVLADMMDHASIDSQMKKEF